MSDPLPSSRRHIFQQASTRVIVSDNPIPVEDILEQPHLGRASFSNNGLRASIRRKLQEAKDTRLVRSISLRSASVPSSTPDTVDLKIQRHSRAFSSSETTRPRVLHTTSSAPDSINVPESRQMEALDNQITPGTLSRHLQPPQSELPPARSSMADVDVPEVLRQGVSMTKVSAKRQKSFVFRLDPDQGQILWESKKSKLIPIENIKELRSASDARYYREQFQLAQDYEERWLTIIYIMDGSYKTLHLIAPTKDIFQKWDSALHKLYTIRQQLMSGLGNIEMRQALWEKQYWKGADQEMDQKLSFDEMERLCKRLNVNSSTDALLQLFKQVDTEHRDYLNFAQFQQFVKLLKARPEVDQLYKKLCSANHGLFDFHTFETFMRDTQKSSLNQAELQKIFLKFATAPSEGHDTSSTTSLPSDTSAVQPLVSDAPLVASPLSSTQSSLVSQSVKPSVSSSSSSVDTPLPETSAVSSVLPLTESLSASPTQTPASASSIPSTYQASASTLASASVSASVSDITHSAPTDSYFLSLNGFSSFLLSTDNSAFTDQHGEIWHDMTRPLAEYFISTSHNTYLVGHQLVGDSTVEGYIRALLHSCRCVELDIYDGDKGPVIFHGKTFTSKVALRQVCQAIAKYAFVTSPYPVIISAEIHCSLPQQDMMVNIMTEVFGSALVRAPIKGELKIKALPSPEDLKGRILLKAKNLFVSQHAPIRDKYISVDTDSSLTETSTSSASESEIVQDIRVELKKAYDVETRAVNDIKGEFKKARNSVLGRVTGNMVTSSAISQALVGPATATATAPLAKLPEKPDQPKIKMSLSVVELLVYTVGVKCRGINKKEQYAPEHLFSLSETTANKILKQGMYDLIKHNRTHVVRIYPKGLRLNSTNYEPHRYWSAGAQLVAINWQTFDLGYMINHTMFQRNGRSGYVLKPLALRTPDKELLGKRTNHILDVKIISAQQLPRLRDASGREIIEKSAIDPFVEVSIHVPDWTHSPFLPTETDVKAYSPAKAPISLTVKSSLSSINSTSARTVSYRTGVVRNNGFNPVWNKDLHLPFDCVGDMKDLIFVRFAIRHEGRDEDDPLAVYCTSLGSLRHGYRHLPLHDAQLSQYMFSTLFVKISIHDDV